MLSCFAPRKMDKELSQLHVRYSVLQDFVKWRAAPFVCVVPTALVILSHQFLSLLVLCNIAGCTVLQIETEYLMQILLHGRIFDTAVKSNWEHSAKNSPRNKYIAYRGEKTLDYQWGWSLTPIYPSTPEWHIALHYTCHEKLLWFLSQVTSIGGFTYFAFFSL